MSPYSQMTPSVARAAKALVRKFPRFGKNVKVLSDGNFEAFLRAPRSSHAGALVCLSSNHGDLWVRFAPPRAFYPIDNARELLTIVHGLLTDELLFILLSKRRIWSGTTLMRRGAPLLVRRGESARIWSWSGRFDRYVRGTRPRRAA